ncbi:gamma-glutamyl-gamma-aminobutyrate hydrolase family protein [Microbacterium sp. W1N]|uniref:anthranilate synthase component II n=1 Tax=Microbacterium festucae TaxID=2977531 RepID=UPI0021BFA945|nr:gamma-glutamyl-gamma-aminobutyrate hydrolase family protein [Microbacterium festucae]MCT9819450.1 gamma-glutamyl-gamma-aminobutyrate hydrolase family protein [Microbacterium festucae]
MASGTGILVVDNHDSFVHTLVGYLHELGAHTTLVEADSLDADALDETLGRYAGVLVSPGPGTPVAAGASIDVVRSAARLGLPLLGVCLGHQALAAAFGATVGHAPELMHGIVSTVHHDGTGAFAGIPSPLRATRYHSLAVAEATLPAPLRVTARSDSGVVMGIAHRDLPLWGVQFHPEAVLTEHGHRLLANWLVQAGMPGAAQRSDGRHPLRA